MNAQTRWTMVAIAGVLLGATALWWRLWSPAPTEFPNGGAAETPSEGVLYERAAEAGIDFRMQFMPSEQGEKFKANLYDHGCGVAVADYDGDGRDDAFLLNQLGPNGLYRNRGDGTFERDLEAEKVVGLADRICVGAAFADYDNDGDQDLYVTTTRGGNALFRNEGVGRFADVTEEMGLTLVKHSQTATFFDFDNDGDLDPMITNSAEWTLEEKEAGRDFYPGVSDLISLVESRPEYNNIYRNDGDRFVDVTEELGLAGRGWGGDLTVFDFDGDGWMDVFVANMFGGSQLFRNVEGKRFQDTTEEVLGHTSFGAIGSMAFDLRNDGRLDLFVADMHSDMWMKPEYKLENIEERARYEQLRGVLGASQEQDDWEQALEENFQIDVGRVVYGNTLYEQRPDGTFDEISQQAGAETFWPWGVAAADFDNDGHVDLFLPSGMGFPYDYWKNSLLMNRGDGTFEERGRELGIEPPRGGPYREDLRIANVLPARSSRCAATADFDGDGRVDLIVNNFNDAPYYFHNRLPQRDYIAFRLRGTQSSRDAIGATVRLYAADKVLIRQVPAAGGYLSQSSKTLHFGLDGLPPIERAEIRWPSGIVQEVARPEINRLHDIVEKM